LNVLITGSSSGIGRATALLLARKGYTVFAGSRNSARLKELGRLARSNGWALRTLRLDVSDEESIRKAIALVSKEGSVDVLVNNAGYALVAPLEEAPISEVRRQMEVNFLGAVRLIQEVLPQMRRQGAGYIINVSSVAGQIAFPFGSAYCASKFALEGLSDSLRIELRPFGIKVVLVEPGATRTNLHKIATEYSKKFVKEGSAYHQLFGSTMNKFIEIVSSGVDPEAVGRVILKAIESKRPRARYQTNLSGKAVLLLKRLLPQGLIDAGTRFRFNFGS